MKYHGDFLTIFWGQFYVENASGRNNCIYHFKKGPEFLSIIVDDFGIIIIRMVVVIVIMVMLKEAWLCIMFKHSSFKRGNRVQDKQTVTVKTVDHVIDVTMLLRGIGVKRGYKGISKCTSKSGVKIQI